MTAEKSAEEVRIEFKRHLRFTIFSGVYDHIGQQARSLAYNSAEAFVAHYRDVTGEEPMFGGTDDSENVKVTLDELKRLIAFYAPRAERGVSVVANATDGADRESGARTSIHRMFGEKCDPATDARLAANSIFLATGMDGPIKLAAERLLRDFSAALIAQKHHPQLREPLLEYVGELRALTLARHASFWVFLIQAFEVPDAMDTETAGYFNAFAPQLDYSMADIIAGRFRQTAFGDELIPWGGALSLLGHFWLPARERGVAESDLMSAMWASPHNWERVGS